MCEITNRNFHEKYPEIVDAISSSDFIAIDCEFTGLTRHTENRIRPQSKCKEADVNGNGILHNPKIAFAVGNTSTEGLFDNAEERYHKLRRGSEDFIALQIGISPFKYRNEKYEASTYTFYLFPRSYSGADMAFLSDPEAIQFLSDQNFDFNKVFREGLTYINMSNEKEIKKRVTNGSVVWRIKNSLSESNRDILQSYNRRVKTWRDECDEGASTVLDVTDAEPFLVYLIKEGIERHFRDVDVTVVENWKELRLTKTTLKRGLRAQEGDDDDLLSLVIGFTRLIKELMSLRKPVIGHNMLTDLLTIYKMFVAPLPEEYGRFKREILGLFPEVYDTKLISAELRQSIGKKDLWKSSSLVHLYKFFSSENGMSVALDMPQVEYKSRSGVPRPERSHDSGFDSYCTGYVFVHLARLSSAWDGEKNTFKTPPPLGNDPVLCFAAVEGTRNRVNLVSGNVPYISLDGLDPVSDKEFILVESLGKEPIDTEQLSDMLAKFDKVDVKSLSDRSALIASSSLISSKVIWKQFVRDKRYRVTKYKGPKFRFANNIVISSLLLGVAGLFYVFHNRK